MSYEVVLDQPNYYRLETVSDSQTIKISAALQVDQANICITVDDEPDVKANNPIVVLRMLFQMLDTLNGRNINIVTFISLPGQKELHKRIVRSYGWKYKCQTCELGSTAFLCTRSNPYTIISRVSEGQTLEVRARYDRSQPHEVTSVCVLVDSDFNGKAKNPITMFRMIFELLEEFERRNIHTVSFVSTNAHTKLHEKIIRSFGWVFDKWPFPDGDCCRIIAKRS